MGIESSINDTMLHISKSTPPMPNETRRTRLKRSRFSMPGRKSGCLVSPRNVPPPPQRTHIMPPPAPPRIRIERILNQNSMFCVRPKSQSMTILIDQSTTENVALSPNQVNNKKIKKPLISTTTTNKLEQYTNYGCSISTKSSSNSFVFPVVDNKKRSNSAKSIKKKKQFTSQRKSKSDPPVVIDKNDDIGFYVKMNKIKTYSVTYRGTNCGLELYPFDTSKKTGAVVLKCHNVYSSNNVIVKSLLVGINDQIVVNEQYANILKTITTLPRPLHLTFYPPPNCDGDSEKKAFKNLTVWLETDDSMRFKSKKLN